MNSAQDKRKSTSQKSTQFNSILKLVLTQQSFPYASNLFRTIQRNLVLFSTIITSLIIILVIVSSISGKYLFSIDNTNAFFDEETVKFFNFSIIFLVIITSLVGVFPISYLAYLFYRKDQSQIERTKNDLKLLGLVTENELKNFEQLYKTVYDPFQFLSFIFLLISISTIIIVVYYLTKTNLNLDFISTTQIEIIFYAFLGAYLFGIRLIVRRYNTFDLQPQVYASIILRILIAGTIAFGIASLIDSNYPNLRVSPGSPSLVQSPTARLSTSGEQGKSTRTEVANQPGNQSNAIEENAENRLLPWQVLAFLIGVFPEQGLRWLTRLGKRAFRDPTLNQFNERSLRKIVGINEWHLARLEELGIDDAQNLANADICRLLLTTQFDTMQVLNWIDQAILHMKAGSRIDQFLSFQITTYHELHTLYTLFRKEVTKAESSSQVIKTFEQNLSGEHDENGRYGKILSSLQELSNLLNNPPSKAPRKEEFDKLLLALGSLSLTELERLCDYSNYPNYIRIQEYYKNIDNVVREQSRRGTQEIIGSSREIGGKFVNPTRGYYEDSLTPQDNSLTPEEREEHENKIKQLDSELQFDSPIAENFITLSRLNYSLGNLEEALDAYSRALDTYSRAVGTDPSVASAYARAYTERSLVHIDLGKRAINQGDLEEDLTKQTEFYKEAQRCFGEAIYDNTVAISIDPTHASAFNNLGLAYMERRDFILALKNLESALKLNDCLGTAYYNRGTVRNTLGKSPKNFIDAALDFERAYLLNYRNSALWANWGLALLNTGQYQEAVEKFTQAIALNNETPVLPLVRRGFAYLELAKEYGQAQGLEISPDYAQQASHDFEQAIKLSPNLSIAYVHYGDLKMLLGDYSGAIKNYHEAIKLGFGDYITYAKVAEAYLRRGKFKEERSDGRGKGGLWRLQESD